MAFLFEDDDEDKNAPGEGGVKVQGAGGGGPGEGVPGGASSGSPAGVQQPFVDVNAYLDKNRGQSLDIANKVATNLGERESGLRSDIAGAESEFGTRVSGGAIRPDSELVERAAFNPTDFIKNQEDLDKFTAQRTAAYKGPRSFVNEYAELPGRVESGVATARGVDSAEGRRTLLQSINPNITRGQSSLDELLIGQNKDARNVLKGAADQFATIDDYLKGVTSSSDAAAKAAEEETNLARNTVSERFKGAGGVIPTFSADLDQRVAADRAQKQERADYLYGKLNTPGGRLTPFEAAELDFLAKDLDVFRSGQRALSDNFNFDNESPFGLGPAKFSENFDINPYIERLPGEQITRANLASAEDYAKEAALEALMGEQLPILFAEDAARAGTAPERLLNVNLDQAYGDARNRLGSYDERFLEGFQPGGANFPALPNINTVGDLQRLADIFKRNEGDLTPVQKQYLADIESGYRGTDPAAPKISPADPLPIGFPDQFAAPEGEGAQDRLRYIEDVNRYPESGTGLNWWNGSEWVDAPPEYRGYNPETGGYAERFNYETGQYEPVTDPDEGIFKAF